MKNKFGAVLVLSVFALLALGIGFLSLTERRQEGG